MQRRLGTALAGMGDIVCDKEQEDVFENALEADVSSAQCLADISTETQQVG